MSAAIIHPRPFFLPLPLAEGVMTGGGDKGGGEPDGEDPKFVSMKRKIIDPMNQGKELKILSGFPTCYPRSVDVEGLVVYLKETLG